jgi:hypothetical protein
MPKVVATRLAPGDHKPTPAARNIPAPWMGPRVD